jgi:hypothetical protein
MTASCNQLKIPLPIFELEDIYSVNDLGGWNVDINGSAILPQIVTNKDTSHINKQS